MVYVLLTLALLLHPLTVLATPFTTNVPGTSLVLPTEYPARGLEPQGEFRFGELISA